MLNALSLYSPTIIQLQVCMEFGRGLAHDLFEIEVKGIATHKQGLFGQGIDGVRQQVALTNQCNGVVDAQHIDVLPICKISTVHTQVLQDSLHRCIPTGGTGRTKYAWFSAGKNK